MIRYRCLYFYYTYDLILFLPLCYAYNYFLDRFVGSSLIYLWL